MIAIVDYGVGNLFSLKSSLAAVGADTVVTSDRNKLRAADRIILPGVGAFGDAAEKLRAAGLDEYLIAEAGEGKPLLGICLGMQPDAKTIGILYTTSEPNSVSEVV